MPLQHTTGSLPRSWEFYNSQERPKRNPKRKANNILSHFHLKGPKSRSIRRGPKQQRPFGSQRSIRSHGTPKRTELFENRSNNDQFPVVWSKKRCKILHLLSKTVIFSFKNFVTKVIYWLQKSMNDHLILYSCIKG